MTKKTEQHYEQEFDRLYSEGKVAERVLDDELPDFRDNWVAERMAGNPLDGVEVKIPPKGWSKNLMDKIIWGK